MKTQAEIAGNQPSGKHRTMVLWGLGLVLLVGLWLRVVPIVDRTAAQIIVGGDAREYIQLAEFFLDTELAPPGNRFPGYSFLLVGLFTVLPFSHEAISVATCIVLGVAVIALMWVLASRVLGPRLALLVAALVALHPGLAHNAHRGLSEELFLVLFLSVLLLYLSLISRTSATWYECAGLIALSGCMSLVRPDAAYAMIPIAGMLLWREKNAGLLTALMKTIPIVVLPFLLPKISQVWMMGLGIEDLDLRIGRSGLWMEFMIGKMPYHYTFYKLTTTAQWFLDHHSIGDLGLIAVKSVVRNYLVLGNEVWGQIALLVAIGGAGFYLRERRDWALPLAVPLAILPQWGLMALWGEDDVSRYNFRIVPLVLLFLVLGCWRVAEILRNRLAMRTETGRWLPFVILAAAMAPSLVSPSLYTRVRPSVDILMHERAVYLPKVSQVHTELTAIWTAMASRRLSLAEAVSTATELRQRHDAYAPTHFVLAWLYVQQGQSEAAIASLEQAMEIIPFFAEAAVLLGELYIIDDRRDEALALLERSQILRPDYPLISLLLGHLHAMSGDTDGARNDYKDYIRLNRFHHERALVRHERIMRRRGETLNSADMRQARAFVTSEQTELTTDFLWSYLSLDLDGITLPRPVDRTTHFNLGVCDLRAGDHESAVQHWLSMTRLVPDHSDAWANLGTLYASRGQKELAVASWRQALVLEPEQALARQGLQHFSEGSMDPASARYAKIKIVLPMTRQRL